MDRSSSSATNESSSKLNEKNSTPDSSHSKSNSLPLGRRPRSPFQTYDGQNIFYSLFRGGIKIDKAARETAKAKFRWDWHLRWFLYSLLPPIALFSFCKYLEYKYENDEVLKRRRIYFDRVDQFEKSLQNRESIDFDQVFSSSPVSSSSSSAEGAKAPNTSPPVPDPDVKRLLEVEKRVEEFKKETESTLMQFKEELTMLRKETFSYVKQLLSSKETNKDYSKPAVDHDDDQRKASEQVSKRLAPSDSHHTTTTRTTTFVPSDENK